jgi:hypothetical protein
MPPIEDIRLPFPKARIAAARRMQGLANSIGHTGFADAMDIGIERIEREMKPRRREKVQQEKNGGGDGEVDGKVEQQCDCLAVPARDSPWAHVHWRGVQDRKPPRGRSRQSTYVPESLHSRGDGQLPQDEDAQPLGEGSLPSAQEGLWPSAPPAHADTSTLDSSNAPPTPVSVAGQQVYRVNTDAAAARWGDPVKRTEERRKRAQQPYRVDK